MLYENYLGEMIPGKLRKKSLIHKVEIFFQKYKMSSLGYEASWEPCGWKIFS